MSEMIERVARAMLAADYPDDVGGELEYLWWDRHGETYLRYARAAIEAMREPTEAMTFAGHDPLETSVGLSNGELYFDAEGPAQTFTAMIDAALK